LLPRHEALRDISVDLFRSNIFAHSKLNPRIVDGACDLVTSDRTGADLDGDMFSKTVNMFHDMHVYTKHFEPRLMELSQEYVIKWADEEAEKPLPEYMKSSRALMDREMSRVAKFGLPNTTRRDLLTLLEDHLISRVETDQSRRVG
jgi:cullin-4